VFETQPFAHPQMRNPLLACQTTVNQFQRSPAMKTVLKVIFVLLIVFLLGGFLLPAKTYVSREIEIARPASFIFQFFNGFKRYNEWSPYLAHDPQSKYSYSGPETGIGAKMSWDGEKLGQGSQTVLSVQENAQVVVDLKFDGGGGKATYALENKGDSTLMRWTFESNAGNNPMMRWMNLALDKFVGPDYEQGLANLKALVEKLPNAKFGNFAVQRQKVDARSVLKIDVVAPDNLLEISNAYSKAYGEISKALAAQNAQALPSAPLGFDLGHKEGKYFFQAALVTASELKSEGKVVAQTLPASDVLYAVHTGNYDKLDKSATLLRAYAEVYGYKYREPVVFAFVDDPTIDPDAARTEMILYLTP
jgi:effector-binding domain-containing protein